VNEAKILILEDEQLVAFDLCSALERHGYVVVGTAKSADEAIQLVQQHKNIDLMIVDFKIRGQMNGEEAASAVRSHFNKPIPVIFISASPLSDIKERMPADPCVFLTKPFKHEALLECVEAVLRSADSSAPASVESRTKS
jgi:CheY-like chemotaxis protein